MSVDHEQEIVLVAQCSSRSRTRAVSVPARSAASRPARQPAVGRHEREGERIGQVGLDVL